METINAALFYQAFKRFRLGLSYNYFDVNVDWTKKGRFVDVNYLYHGPTLLFMANF